jgi:hypothetical protein
VAARDQTKSAHSDRLHQKIEFVYPMLRAAGRRLFTHPRIRDLYPEYLFTSHCIIRASVPLMEAARGRAAALAETDRAAAAVGRYLDDHIDEERNHDEWLLDDLEVLGRGRSAVWKRPPSPAVAGLVGSQYYWVLHYHPVALLGYMALLEGYPPVRSQIDDLIDRTGYPPSAFRTMIHHADLDPKHGDDLNRTIDGLPLSQEQAAALGLSAMSTVHLMTGAIDEIIEGAGGGG